MGISTLLPEAKRAWILNASCQICTASTSFFASFIVAAMVARSKNTNNHINQGNIPTMTPSSSSVLKSSPYHRIIFGMSIFDILHSFALLSGPFAPQRHIPQAFWAVGNDVTCKLNGVSFMMGSMGSPLYMFFLCYYCFCKIKKNWTDDTFSRKIEWKLHGLFTTLNIAMCIACLATKSLNSNIEGHFCAVAASPTGCAKDPEIYGECDESIARHAVYLAVISWFGITFTCLVGIIVCMVRICWHVMIRTRKFGILVADHNASGTTSTRPALLRMSPPQSTSGSTNNIPSMDNLDEDDLESPPQQKVQHQPQSSPLQQPSQEEQPEYPPQSLVVSTTTSCSRPVAIIPSSSTPRPSDLVLRYRREFVIQASLYALVFIGTNFFVWFSLIVLITTKKTVEKVFVTMAAILYPLSGLFNILVYTRPKVLSLRRKHPDMSRFRAFVLVVKAGMVVPMVVLEEEEEDRHGAGATTNRLRAAAVGHHQQPFISGGGGASNSLNIMNDAGAGGVVNDSSSSSLISISTPPVILRNILSSQEKDCSSLDSCCSAERNSNESSYSTRRKFYRETPYIPNNFVSGVFDDAAARYKQRQPQHHHTTSSTYVDRQQGQQVDPTMLRILRAGSILRNIPSPGGRSARETPPASASSSLVVSPASWSSSWSQQQEPAAAIAAASCKAMPSSSMESNTLSEFPLFLLSSAGIVTIMEGDDEHEEDEDEEQEEQSADRPPPIRLL